jgi:hypothetical protein
VASSLLDQARDELFSHINRCGVLHASPEDQKTWMGETVDYLAERYPDLGDAELDSLHGIGLRFCQPAIAHGADSTARSQADATAPSTEEASTDAAAEEAVEEGAEEASVA